MSGDSLEIDLEEVEIANNEDILPELQIEEESEVQKNTETVNENNNQPKTCKKTRMIAIIVLCCCIVLVLGGIALLVLSYLRAITVTQQFQLCPANRGSTPYGM